MIPFSSRVIKIRIKRSNNFVFKQGSAPSCGDEGELPLFFAKRTNNISRMHPVNGQKQAYLRYPTHHHHHQRARALLHTSGVRLFCIMDDIDVALLPPLHLLGPAQSPFCPVSCECTRSRAGVYFGRCAIFALKCDNSARSIRLEVNCVEIHPEAAALTS